MEAKQLAAAIAASLDKHKAEDLRVIATGTSSTQVKSLADYVETELKEQGVEPLRQEGYASSTWVLMDYGDVVVHIFTQQTRGFYDLERLWKDGAQLPLSDFLPEADS